MKKSSVFAVASLGLVGVAGAAPSMAAPSSVVAKAPVVGNLQHTTMKFWCSKGVPNYFVAVRAVKTPEATVTVTQTQLNQSRTLGPVTHTQAAYFFSTINQAGKKVTLVIKGNTSGSTFTVSGTIPTTCAGLPTIQPDGAVTKPTAPTKGTMPTKPMKPGMPMKPMPGSGPKVQTDYVAPHHSSDALGLAGLGGVAVAAAGAGVIARRRMN